MPKFKVGRPKIFSSPDEMASEIEKYFKSCHAPLTKSQLLRKAHYSDGVQIKPYTIEGLAMTLGMDRRSFFNYAWGENYSDFFPVVRHAVQKINTNIAERALSGKNNSTVSVFMMKCSGDYLESPQEHKIEATVVGNTNLSVEQLTKILADKEDE